MKLIKALVLTALSAGSLIVCASAPAQDSTTTPPAPAASTNAPPARPHSGNHSMSADRLAEVLNLTDAQKTQVQAVLDGQRQKMRDLHQDTSLSQEDRRSKMKEIRDDTSAQLQPILTPEQFAKWQNLTHAHRPMPKATPPASSSTNAPAGSGQ
jgi:periplasmic protein CpxP/Spy